MHGKCVGAVEDWDRFGMGLATCLQESDPDALRASAAPVIAPNLDLVSAAVGVVDHVPAETAAVLSVNTAAARVRDAFPGDDFVPEEVSPLFSERGRVEVYDQFAEYDGEDLRAKLGG